jgi:hypothetical protein
MGIDSRFFKPNWESYPFILFFSFFSITLKTPAGLLLLLLFQWLSLFLFHSQKNENGQEKKTTGNIHRRRRRR